MEEVDFEPIEIEGLNYVLHALPFGR
jgi:hypothetical protein